MTVVSTPDARACSRRSVLSSLAGAAALTLGAPMINLGRSRAFAGSVTYSTRALDLVGRCLVIDMLGLLTFNSRIAERWLTSPQGITPGEIQTFKTSGINVFHNSRPISGPTAHADALTYLAATNGFIATNGEHFARIDRASDLRQVKASNRIGVIIGTQNADLFRSAADVPMFQGLGLRCAQLTYNSQNLIGSGSTDRIDGGISDFGAEIIQAMNKTGMLIDVSHSGDRTTLDAIELSSTAIAITHSNCRALNPHPRLKTDEAIRRLAAKGGVMGVTGLRNFVRDREPTTIDHLVDHVDHIAKLVGIEHAGVGTDADLDGLDDLPADLNRALRSGFKPSYGFRERIDIEGFDHPRKVFDLAEALMRRGYKDADIEAVLGGNFERLLKSVWR